jgi:quinol monooxygenase YgiN
MSKYGMYVKFITHDRKREKLAHTFLQVAQMMNTVTGCELYVINQSVEDENAIWVTEVWSSKEAHQASLSMEGNKDYIMASLSLIKQVEKELQPLGGHGI